MRTYVGSGLYVMFHMNPMLTCHGHQDSSAADSAKFSIRHSPFFVTMPRTPVAFLHSTSNLWPTSSSMCFAMQSNDYRTINVVGPTGFRSESGFVHFVGLSTLSQHGKVGLSCF